MDLEDLDYFLQILYHFLNSEQVWITCACFHSLGQFCEDKRGEIQKKYFKELLTICYSGIESKVNKKLLTKIEKIRGYALALLTNFLEGCHAHLLQNCKREIFSKISFIIEKDSFFCVLQAIASLSNFCMVSF